MKKIIAGLAVAFLLSSCVTHTKGEAGQPGKPETPGTTKTENFTLLKQESYGGWDEPGNTVITSQTELNEMYKELSLTDVPEIDFESRTVVALFMGRKNTGGYSIGIASVNITNDIAEITIRETKPEGMATTALTSPYCIAAIPKTGKVKFVQ